MVKRSEVLVWPAKFGLQQTRRVGRASIEATKTLARKQVEFGQTILRAIDPKEFVTYRAQEEASEEGRQAEIEKLGKDLREHDPKHPKYPELIQFSVPLMLKLIDQWKDDGSPISKDGIDQVERFFRDNSVPEEFITASLAQVPREKNIEELVAEIPAQPPEQSPEIEIYSPS